MRRSWRSGWGREGGYEAGIIFIQSYKSQIFFKIQSNCLLQKISFILHFFQKFQYQLFHNLEKRLLCRHRFDSLRSFFVSYGSMYGMMVGYFNRFLIPVFIRCCKYVIICNKGACCPKCQPGSYSMSFCFIYVSYIVYNNVDAWDVTQNICDNGRKKAPNPLRPIQSFV